MPTTIMTQVNGYPNKYKKSNEINKIRISIVDDLNIIREGLNIILQRESDFEVVGMTDSGKKAIALVAKQRPDVVLMDIKLSELDGIRSTRIICEQFPETKILVLSSYNKEQYLIECLKAGAKGYFLKTGTPARELIEGIRAINKGYCQISPGLLENVIRRSARPKLPGDDLPLRSEEISKPNLPTTFKPEEISKPNLPTTFKPDLESKPTLALTEETGEIEATIESESSLTLKDTSFGLRTLMWTIIGIATLIISGLAIAVFKPDISGQASESVLESSITPSLPEPTAVSALGRIEPEGEIIQLSVSSAAEGSRVEKLLVERGDKVQQGQVVAILDSHNRSRAALESAKADVQIAQANLERVKAGAKQGDIDAQKATINRLEAELRGQIATQQATLARLEAELENAEVEDRRRQELYEEGAISSSERDAKRLRVKTVQRQLEEAQETLNRTIETTKVQSREAKARLESIAEVRAEDVQVARAELAQAKAAVKQAEATLELTEVRSPIDGQVLKVQVRPGEVIGNRGIAEIGKTEQMYVVAEVYETDIKRLKIGQRATVTAASFSEELQGKVAEIGLKVSRQDVFNSDPLADTDNKVVEVKIRLAPESSARVASLSNLQVQVVIQL
ncbi:MAG: response regulator [Xenococcaceae cyanobacterium MO_167.B52]|nr:response regulator [Xenococcaceae cyanobacterium MO_167.B52]